MAKAFPSRGRDESVDVDDALRGRERRLVVIAFAHDLGFKHRHESKSPLYDDADAHIAQLAADTAGLAISARDASRWETAALIAYRGAYDA